MKCVLQIRFCHVILLLLFVGCGKKEGASSITQPASNAAATATSPDTASAVNTSKALADSDAALKARQYDQAVASLLLLQQQKGLNEQQAQAVKDQQVKIQRSLASAVASGDPKAKAAADMLRAASAHH